MIATNDDKTLWAYQYWTKSFLLFQSFTYDHVELNFYLNDENLNCPLYGIKGTVFPVFYGKNMLWDLGKTKLGLKSNAFCDLLL